MYKFIFALLLVSSSALAEDYLNINLAARHFDRAATERLDLNEINQGVGLERDLGTIRYLGGFYKNSDRITSAYVLVGYTPFQTQHVKFGMTGGMVSGYSRSLMPAISLLTSVQFGKVGVNLYIVPSVRSMNVYGFASAQLRYLL